MTNPSVSASVSVWQTTAVETSFPQLASDIVVDVAVVGGGITGLTTALLLKRAGLSVAVLEGLHVGGGVTGYTTAHISEVPDIGYQHLISNFGERGALVAVQSRRAAIEQIAKLVLEEQIECSFERVPGYLYTESSKDVSYLESEVEAARKLGIDAIFTTYVPLPFPIKAGILFPHQAQFHSLQYLQALAKAVSGGRGHIFERTRVLDVSGESPYKVSTQRGSVTAKNVILATHTPINDLSHLQDVYLVTAKLIPYRSYVLGVRLLSSPAPEGLFWDTEDPYHYTRKYVDPMAGEFLIVGGADHKTGEDVDTEARYQQLEQYVRSRFAVESIPYRWSAQWYQPVDGLPFIGKSPAHDHLYVATGYSGNGISFGTIAGMLLADTILGRPNPWSELYNANRVKPLAAGQQFLAQNLDIAKHFIADRFKRNAQTIDEVPKGEGRIVEIDGEQVAIYREQGGAIHALSPVCSHLGCIVNWNKAEKSWDCPCHGGRFSCTGEILNGPPIKNLEPKQLSQ